MKKTNYLCWHVSFSWSLFPTLREAVKASRSLASRTRGMKIIILLLDVSGKGIAITSRSLSILKLSTLWKSRRRLLYLWWHGLHHGRWNATWVLRIPWDHSVKCRVPWIQLDKFHCTIGICENEDQNVTVFCIPKSNNLVSACSTPAARDLRCYV